MSKPDGYIEVNDRIQAFYAKYPEGSLQAFVDPEIMTTGDKTFIVYAAAAYRNPDDPRPGIGYAWEPVPGPTSFTKDSELQNAETSAWGRAIAALGFEVREGIATKEDVQARTATKSTKSAKPSTQFKAPAAKGRAAMPADKKRYQALDELILQTGVTHEQIVSTCVSRYGHPYSQITNGEADDLIRRLQRHAENKKKEANVA